nr:DRTGG domain-containing protein [uncultured Carboxylicivirga sp.]
MKIKEIAEILEAKVVCGEDDIERDIRCGFASDLMSDVLTLDSENLALITGLANMQVIRTAEMADVNCIVFVRDKHVSNEMIEVAKENDMVLLECKYSMFNTIGKLFQAGLTPVY